MSSPIRKTRSSLSSAIARASRIACAKVISRSGAFIASGSAVGIDVARERGGRGRRACRSEGDRRSYLALDARPDRLHFAGRDEAERFELRFEHDDRIASSPALDLLSRPIAVSVAARMAARTIGLGFDQGRPLAELGAINRSEGGLRDLSEGVAVDDDAWHSISRGALGDILDRGRTLRGHRHAVLIVLANKYYRQLPNRGDVQGLVKGALVVGAVAEEGDRHRPGAALLGAERSADSDRNAAPDDAVRAEIAFAQVGDMHRAAAPVAIAGLSAEEFCIHASDIGAFGDAMTMTAMRRSDVVRIGQGRANADRRRLLANRKMHRTVAEAAHIGVLGGFLEAADQMHLAQGRAQLVR